MTTSNTQTANINGVTVKDITRMMNKTEKIIAYFNTKYNFDLSFAPAKDIKEYEAALRNWDFMKTKRNQLKTV